MSNQSELLALADENRIDVLRLKAFRTNDPGDKEAYFAATSKWFQDRHYRYLAASAPAGDDGEVDTLRSSPSFHADPIEQLAFELAWELEEAELRTNDLVTINRDKLKAIARRMVSRARPPAPTGDAVAWRYRDNDMLDGEWFVSEYEPTPGNWDTIEPLYARPPAPAVEVREGWRYEIQHGPDSETDYAWVYDDKNNMVCTTKTHHAMAIVAARGGISLDASDVHYLGAIKLRLERLYEENPNDCRLREHISDEVSWIDGLTEALSASPREMVQMSNLLAKIRALPVRKEYMGGQLHTYVLLDNVVALVEVAPMASGIKPGPSEPSPSSRSETAGPPRWPRAGDRMTFLGENGYDYELQAAMKIFEVGAEYIVRGCDVGDWRHTISFEGKPGHFNGVMFARIAPDCSGCKPGGVQKEDATRIEGSMQSEGANAKSGGAT